MNEDYDASVDEEVDRLLERGPKPRALTSESLRAPLDDLDVSSGVILGPDATVREAIDRMKADHVSAVLVSDAEGRLAGIFTERDVVKRVIDPQRDWGALPLSEFMTPRPEALREHEPIFMVLNLMHNGGYRHVPVVDEEGRPKGIVAVADVVAYLSEFFAEEVCNLPPDPHREVSKQYGG